MFSIAKQVFRGTALTQKQHELVKSLLVEYYADQFKERDIDVVEHVDNLRFPYREVNQEHWLKVLDVKHRPHKPLSKDIEDEVRDLSDMADIQFTPDFDPEDK